MNGLENKKGVAYFEYDFSKHGGAVGAIDVYGNGIPKGAVIQNGLIHTKVALTSGGTPTTLAIKALTAGDIKAATNVASFSLNALLATIPVGTAATSIRVTSNIQKLTFTVATPAVTAGKIAVALDYVVTDPD